MYVVTVTFRFNPEHRDAFMSLMLENARLSREDEPGCRQFDVCVNDARPDTVFLYELYDDRAAFDAHLESAHFKSFAAAVQPMLSEREIDTWQRASP